MNLLDLSIFEKYRDGADSPSEATSWFLLTDCVVRQGERCRYAKLTLWPSDDHDGPIHTTVDEEHWAVLSPYLQQLDQAKQGNGPSVLVPVFKGRDGRWKFSHQVAAAQNSEASTRHELLDERRDLVRLQTYLPPEQREHYRRVAAERGLDIAEFTRRALEAYAS